MVVVKIADFGIFVMVAAQVQELTMIGEIKQDFVKVGKQFLLLFMIG